MKSDSKNWSEFATAWEDETYNRLRFSPTAGDYYYLPLSDLRIYLERIRTDQPLCVLDYGAGPSPYRSLLPKADYRRADYVPSAGLTYVVGGDSRVPERDGVFDLVLSTQVAEHLASPAIYLAEAFRLLRPGGRLVLTTHGIWPDHGTPYDFQRWTAAGLARDVAQAGFVNLRSSKLTGGHRAYAFLTLDMLSATSGGRTWLRNFILRSMQGIFRRSRPWLHRKIDALWPRLRVAELGEDPNAGPPFYIGVAVEAERPAS